MLDVKTKTQKRYKTPTIPWQKKSCHSHSVFLFIKQKDLVYVTPVYQAVQNLKVIV